MENEVVFLFCVLICMQNYKNKGEVAMKAYKKTCLGLLAVLAVASASIGAGMVTQAQTTIDESKFTLYKGASVRMDGTTEYPNAKGLRFKTYAEEFKDDLHAVYSPSKYTYHWYTQLRFQTLKSGSTTEYQAYVAEVNANVWNSEGWNTVLLNIPTSAMATDITAQSFVAVKDKKGAVVYEADTDTRTYSAAETASWALAYNMYSNDTQKNFLLTYVNSAISSGAITGIVLSNSAISVDVGASDDISVRSEPFGYGITFTSSNPSVATVDGDGRVTGVATGSATITMSIGSSISKTCKVTVNAAGTMETDLAPITSWSGSASSWSTSAMYPFYKGSGTPGSAAISGGLIKVTSAGTTAGYLIDSGYLAKIFAYSQVKAVRLKLTGMSNYKVGTFITYYTKTNSARHQTSENLRYEQYGDTLYLVFDRAIYEHYVANRRYSSTKFEFLLHMQKATDTVVSGSSSLTSFGFTLAEVKPMCDTITEDFEYGANAAISTSPTSTVEKTNGENGRGMYALSANVTSSSLRVNVTAAYANKVFNSGATALQFRVYTDKDLSSVTINGYTTGVQYKYNADGEYYVIRVSNTYKGSSLSVILTGEEALGQVYLDAFTGTDKELGENVTKSAAYATDEGGAPQYKTDKVFNFYAYSSLSNGKLDDNTYEVALTLETLKDLKEAGFDAIMPQSAAAVGEASTGKAGDPRGAYDYKTVLDLAQQAGLKVILTDDPLLYLSAGKQYDASGAKWSNWKGFYESAKETSGQWAGAAQAGTTMYEKVKAQLASYINHPAFYGVLMVDEPSAWMLDESLAVPTDAEYTKAGTYGFTYKTVKRVAQEQFSKDIFIQADILPAGNYTDASYGHGAGQRFPELTVKEYGEITGMNVSSYAVDSKGYATSSTFYTKLESFIDQVGSSSTSTESFREKEMRIEIQRRRFGKYCEMFLDCTGAPYIMPDIYPLERGALPLDRHLMEIQTAAEVAAKYGVELHLITQTMKRTNPERQLTEQDMRWLNNELLAFGVKNIVYFTYHVHGSDGNGFDYDSSFVDETGERTDVYYAMQEIMAENKAFQQTYQSFNIQSTKVYYQGAEAHNSVYGHYAHNVNYRDNSLYGNDSVTFNALTNVVQNSELTIISEFAGGNGYMYAIMNATDSKYASDYTAHDTVTLTFNTAYTHAIVWRNGVKKLVALDANHSLEVENAAGDVVFVIPYLYEKPSDYFGNAGAGDNGIFFPGNPWAGESWGTSNYYGNVAAGDNGVWFPDDEYAGNVWG